MQTVQAKLRGAARAILVTLLIQAIRMVQAIRAIPVMPTLRTARTILVMRVIPTVRAISVILAVWTIQAIRAIRTMLVTRVVPASRTISAILAVRTIQTIAAIRAMLATRVIPACRATSAILAVRTIQTIAAIRAMLATRVIPAIRQTLVVRVIPAIQAIPTTRAVQYAFHGSLAGRIGILVVLVGAAAAYGMPGRLPALTPSTMSSTALMSLPLPPTTTPVDDFNTRFGSAYGASHVESTGAAAPERAPLHSDIPGRTDTPLAATPAPVQLAALPADPLPEELPKAVEIQLPMPKPPLSPAQRLELQGKDYDKAEKCLAQAIYFEARNEPARGQQAVAQVVLNRVFSPYYPKDVCSVVYQNAHRHLACQFTFACDGKADRIRERGSWARANRIATQTLNARVWLSDVNKSTHYHAAYVRPYWIRDMKTMARYGLHIFYRPRNWGDGSDEAHWDTPSNSVKPTTVAAKPAAAARRPAAAARRYAARRAMARAVRRSAPHRRYAYHYRT